MTLCLETQQPLRIIITEYDYLECNKSYNDYLARIKKAEVYSWIFKMTRIHLLLCMSHLSKIKCISDQIREIVFKITASPELSKKGIKQLSSLIN